VKPTYLIFYSDNFLCDDFGYVDISCHLPPPKASDSICHIKISGICVEMGGLSVIATSREDAD
jgi:hypothetical protein